MLRNPTQPNPKTQPNSSPSQHYSNQALLENVAPTQPSAQHYSTQPNPAQSTIIDPTQPPTQPQPPTQLHRVLVCRCNIVCYYSYVVMWCRSLGVSPQISCADLHPRISRCMERGIFFCKPPCLHDRAPPSQPTGLCSLLSPLAQEAGALYVKDRRLDGHDRFIIIDGLVYCCG